MHGKNVIVTGANSGIGRATAQGLARMGATVIMACRNEASGEEAADAIRGAYPDARFEVMPLDLGAQDSIRAFADAYRKRFGRLDVLVNNAAIVPARRKESADGFELQFAVNHLGPFLLTNLLLDALKESAPSRIVNVSSDAHQGAEIDFDDLQSKRRYRPTRTYGRTKLMNILFTKELARRLNGTGVTANCLHPGVVSTNIFRALPRVIRAVLYPATYFMLDPEQGAETSVFLCTSPDVQNISGKYFEKCQESIPALAAENETDAKRLWAESAKLCGLPADWP